MEAELEHERSRRDVELEEEAAAEGGGGEFDLQRRQPRQRNMNGSTSTTKVTINDMSTTTGLSSSSEHSPGADFSQLFEQDDFSYESFALTSGGEVNFYDSKNKSTTPGTVMGTVVVDIATESFGIEAIDEPFKSTDPPPSNKNSSIQEQIAAETSIDIGAIEQEGRVRIDIREEIEEQKETREEIEEQKEIRDLYLETVYKKPASSDFYCPNCQACIDKVLIRSKLEEGELRCPSCFAFLKLLGDWIFRKPVPTQVPGIKKPTDQPKPADTVPPTTSSTVEPQTHPSVTGEIQDGDWIFRKPVPTQVPGIKKPTDQPKPDDAVQPPPPPLTLMPQKTPDQHGNEEPSYQLPRDTARSPPSSTLTAVTGEIPEKPTYQLKPEDTVHPTPTLTPEARTHTSVTGEIQDGDWSFRKPVPTQVPGIKKPTDQPKPADTVPPTTSSTVEPQTHPSVTGEIEDGNKEKPDGAIKLEIVKSLVYGGLTESITSLSVVTSAASAAASTLSIVVLALANLIGGLFIIGHNLRELKNDQYRVTLNETEERTDRYLQVLGQKKNFIIHASVAVLSFLVCGLVPPVVYAFSFYKSDNSYLKLAVVAVASLICITILAIAKAYIQKPTRWYMYLRTVMYYVSLGVGASGISYLAGYLFKLLIDKLGWFESSAAVTLSLPGMSSVPSAQVSS